MIKTCLPLLRSLVVIGMLLTLSATSVFAETERELIRTMRQSLVNDDLVGAREALVNLISRRPRESRLHYNLSCLDARLGEPEAAMSSLKQALDLGFDDLRLVADDPDLGSIHSRADFLQLLQDTAEGLALSSRRQARILTEGDVLPLQLNDRRGPKTDDIDAELRIDHHGFHLRVEAPASWIVEGPSPWLSGGGVELILAAPDSNDTYDTRQTWHFGFGQRNGLPVGVVLATPEHAVDQQVLELAPRISWDATKATRTLEATVPWAYLSPYAMPADSAFGVNLRVVRQTERGRRYDSLIADPGLDNRSAEFHRYLPLTLRISGQSPARMHGRVKSTIVGRRPFPFDIVVWTPSPVTAILVTDVLGNEGQSVVTSGGKNETIKLPAGLTTLQRFASLADLPDGPFHLRARLELENGTAMEWRTGLFRFGGSWIYQTTDRAKPLSDMMRPSIDWRLELITHALSNRDPRSSPAPLMTTVAEVDDLLGGFENSGTILPASGDVVLMVPGDLGSRLVRLHFTPGWFDQRRDLIVLSLLTPEAMRLQSALIELTISSGRPIAIAAPDLGAGSERSANQLVFQQWLQAMLPDALTLTVGGPDADLSVAGEGSKLSAAMQADRLLSRLSEF